MVYLATQIIKGKNYYYLVEPISLGKGKRKQIRKYIGTEKPAEKKLSWLMFDFSKFVEKEKIKLGGFAYLDKKAIEEINTINSNFWKRYNKCDKISQQQFDKNFLMVFVYNTNSIEGSTLTLREVELLLEENIAPNKSIKDVFEVKNAEKAIEFIKQYKGDFDLSFVLKIHEIYFRDSFGEVAGKLKRRDNRVIGSRFETTPASKVLEEMKFYFDDYKQLKKKLHPLELAAWVHWKFVRIHPFQDGNGRTARLLMNFILHSNGYSMIDIKTKEKQVYFKALERCNLYNNAQPLASRLTKHFQKQYENALK